ncbi:MAG: NUDIX domain-containing protein [Candidatus Colwellbacteria bacterium]|nr:NUDIX domain-containing protein [Candidatus Colwellbacteria bacterium]
MKKGVDYIGVTCVFFCHDGKGKFLLHKRSNNCRDEQGRWDCGGGALELGEDFETAVRREIKEEYCADVADLKFLTATNVLRKNGEENTHWVALIFAAEVIPEQVKIGEPEAMEEIGWFRGDSLPNPLHSQFLRHFAYVQQVGLAYVALPRGIDR